MTIYPLFLSQIASAHRETSCYLTTYCKRLCPKNKFHLRQILFLLRGLLRFLRKVFSAPAFRLPDDGSLFGAKNLPGVSKSASLPVKETFESPDSKASEQCFTAEKVISITDFVFEAGIDNINLFKVYHFSEVLCVS